jgi:hypothetical protein
MKRDFEYMNYSERERLAMLENRAAELERMLGRATHGYAASEHDTDPEHDADAEYGAVAEHGAVFDYGTGVYPAVGYQVPDDGADDEDETAGLSGHGHSAADRSAADHGTPGHWDTGAGRRDPAAGYPNSAPWYQATGSKGGTSGTSGHRRAAPTDYVAGGFETTGFAAPGFGVHGFGGTGPGAPTGFPGAGFGETGFGVAGYDEAESGGYPGADLEEPDERTEQLINRGRQNARPAGRAFWLRHWRAIAIAGAGLVVGSFLLAVILPGGGASWPASVAAVQSEISVACQNPNVVSEPSQVNFACAKASRQILWVFSLLTSGDNPNFTDRSNGRTGLEPITPAQGGDVAWSLNLHHPYDPTSPTDSLEVAARAINDIIGGATLTGSNGAPVVQPGLESNPANCARYTGSSALVTKAGFPAICAQPVISAGGQAALVSDVFEQWMVGTPPRIAAEAGVLFDNADNPGDSGVQAILNSLPDSGL